jgi:class 3 adenylate cyclase
MIMFWLLNYPELAYYNIFSIAAFCFGNWRIYQGDLKTATYLCILIEVPGHAILATLLLGFNAGFWLLVFISVSCVAISPLFSRLTRFALSIGIAMFLGVVGVYAIHSGAYYDVPSWLSYLFLMMNLLIMTFVVATIIVSYDVAVEDAEKAQQVEFERAEGLLLNILPSPIAERLKAQEEPLADSLNAVTVLFSDIAGFTNLSRGMSAEQLVTLLNELFSRFDMLVEKYGAEKIKSIGDAYMVATGLDNTPDHAQRMIDLAQDMHAAFDDFRARHHIDLGLRTGVHSGAAVAGVIGKQKFAYDLWGDAVNVASRMDSTGVQDRIQISSETRNLLPSTYPTEQRGLINIKGHADRETYLVVAR